MKIFNLIALLFIVLVFSGCYDVVDIKVPAGEKLVAVDGTITNQPGPYLIKLNYTAPYFSANSDPNPPITGAIVKMADSEGHSETLTESSPGKYLTAQMQGKIGNKYTLSIKIEGEEYKAETEIKRVPPIDSISFVPHVKRKNDDKDRDGFYARYFGPETPGEGDYYRFKVYRNDTLFNKPDDLVFSNDQMVDGNYIANVDFTGLLVRLNDKVRFETLTITEDNYYFYVELATQLNNANAGLFANPIANIRTNVINQDKTSKKRAVGYFVGAGLSFKEGIITSKDTKLR